MFASHAAMLGGAKTPVTYVSIGYNNGAWDPQVPAHQAGDMLVAWVGNWNATPTKPTASGNVPDWIDIWAGTGGRLCWCFGTGTTTGGVWGSLGYSSVAVFRGAKSIGAFSVFKTSYGAVPNITLSEAGGSSAILGHAPVTTGSTTITPGPTVPADWTNIMNGISSTTGDFVGRAWVKTKATNGTGIGSIATGTGMNIAVEIKA